MTIDGNDYFDIVVHDPEGRGLEFGAAGSVVRKDSGRTVKRFRGHGTSAKAAQRNATEQARRWIESEPTPEDWNREDGDKVSS